MPSSAAVRVQRSTAVFQIPLCKSSLSSHVLSSSALQRCLEDIWARASLSGCIITFNLSKTLQLFSVVDSFIRSHHILFCFSVTNQQRLACFSIFSNFSHSFEPKRSQQSCTPHSFFCWRLATSPVPRIVSSRTLLARQLLTTTWRPLLHCQMVTCQLASPTTQLTLVQQMDLV